MNKLLILLCTVAVLFSCSKDTVETEITADLTMKQNIDLNAKEQTPLANLDNDTKGIYLGVYVSGTTTKRGLIWINLGNNGNYNAIVELVDGETLSFQGQLAAKGAFIYHFTAKGAQFDVVLEDNVPAIKNASLNNELFFGEIVKDKSNTRAMAETGFYQSDDGNRTGTWSLIADGTSISPNGFGGEGITSAVVTNGGSMFTDTVFENWNFPCVGVTAFIPVIVDFDTGVSPDTPAVLDQTSDFAGTTTWGLLMNGDDGTEYADRDCNTVPAGRFARIGFSGDIFMDNIP